MYFTIFTFLTIRTNSWNNFVVLAFGIEGLRNFLGFQNSDSILGVHKFMIFEFQNVSGRPSFDLVHGCGLSTVLLGPFQWIQPKTAC